MPSDIYQQALVERRSRQLADVMGGSYDSFVLPQSAIVVSNKAISVRGQTYSMDTSGLGAQPGDMLNVKNIGRDGVAKWAPSEGGAVVVSAGNTTVQTVTPTPVNNTTLHLNGPNGNFVSFDKSGSFTFRSPFAVLDGSGSLTLNGGLIGGWTIAAGQISTTHAVLNSTSEYIAIGATPPTDYGQVGIFLGISSSVEKFSLYKDATHYLIYDGTNVAISGTVTAGAGNIGGWALTAGQIATTHVILSSASEYIAIGATPPADYGQVGVFLGISSGVEKFSLYRDASHFLTYDGSNVALSGSITATSGAIAGPLTVSGSLSIPANAGNGSTAGIKVDTTGIAGYNASSATKQFYWDATTGAGIAGAGAITLDANGITLVAPGTLTTTYQLKWLSGATAIFSIGADSAGNVSLRGGTGSIITINNDTSSLLIGNGFIAISGAVSITGSITGVTNYTGSGGINLGTGSGAAAGSIVASGTATIGVPGNSPMPMSSGSAWPASPVTGQIHWHTTYHQWAYYDGTRWLSSIEYSATIPDAVYTASGNSVMVPLTANLTPYITRVAVHTNVATTNNGTNYWQVQAQGYNQTLTTGAVAGGWTGSTGSGPDTAGTWYTHANDTLTYTAMGSYKWNLCGTVIKQGSPGNLTAGFTIYYRLILT